MTGIRTKYLLTYILFAAAVIALLNTYPVAVSRDLVFISKQESVLPHAIQIGAVVETTERMTPETVGQVMSMTETDSLSRVSVFNTNQDELYSARNDVRGYDERVLFSLVSSCMEEENDEFHCTFSDGAFRTYAAIPVMSGNEVVGAVCVYEYDDDQGALVLGLRDDMRKASVILGLAALIFGVILSQTLTYRVKRVLNGVREVREGDYNFQVAVKGHDELSELAGEFNELTRRIRKTEEQRRQFVSDASHELKTPLAAIRLLSDSILETDNMDVDTMKEFVIGIRDESERLARTTGQLLDLTKLDRDVVTVRGDVDCSRVAGRVLSTLRPIAAKAGITLESDLAPDCHIMATEDDLFHIIHNLVDNAVKYNTENGRIHLSVTQGGDTVTIEVEDTGIGIPPEDIPYIFDRFYRVEKSRDREEGGTGLGLSIVKACANRHGGEVTARRREQGGMVFTVTFPRFDRNKAD